MLITLRVKKVNCQSMSLAYKKKKQQQQQQQRWS